MAVERAHPGKKPSTIPDMASPPAPVGASTVRHENTVIESLQSLIVAFVLAMTFRGFVTEGFVIPTGSMAPTLLGQHVLLHSPQTGDRFPVGIDANGNTPSLARIPDPMLGPGFPGSGVTQGEVRPRMGDRILVLKCLYPFFPPHRFDVVVFKNPTDPDGKSANYIKRLIGLPNEKLLLLDGDVFAAPNQDGTTLADYRIQRKPAHVQLAVWQAVDDSDYVPIQPDRLPRPYAGPPWQGAGWDTSGRAYHTESIEPTTLRWDSDIRMLDDWTSYDSLGGQSRKLFPVSDLRVRAGIEADRFESMESTFQITCRSHVLQFVISGGPAGQGTAQVRMRPEAEPADAWSATVSATFDLPDDGGILDVEFWHVDQNLSLLVNGDRIASLDYDWSAEQRLKYDTGIDQLVDADKVASRGLPLPKLEWRFRGSPITLHRVATSRDLYYRTGVIDRKASENPTSRGFEKLVEYGTPAIATAPSKPAVLGPDHYFMLGDNSQASLDGRLWGNPHPLVAEQVDPTPFVVHRSLLIGKAWVVYFPAPFRISENGVPVVPDFGRLRFIR